MFFKINLLYKLKKINYLLFYKYYKHTQRQTNTHKDKQTTTTNKMDTSSSTSNTEQTQTPINTQKNKENKEKKKDKSKNKKKNRCAFKGCKKKLTLATVTCKCDKRFCGIHRQQERHQCPVIKTLNTAQIMQKCGLGGGTFSKLEVI